MMDWKQEAQIQAADAGELKIALAAHLDELRLGIQDTCRQLENEDDTEIQVQLCMKEMLLRREYDWMAGILAGKRCVRNGQI